MPRPRKATPINSSPPCSNTKSNKTRGSKVEIVNRPPSSSPVAPIIQVTHSNEGDRKTGYSSETVNISYSMGNRSFSLATKGGGYKDRVFMVLMQFKEEIEGKGSVNLSVLVSTDHASNGPTCGTTIQSTGAVNVDKKMFSSPTTPDTEIVSYYFEDPTLCSCFILEKPNAAELGKRMVTATHCFYISEDEFYYVAIKISCEDGEGLCPELEGPEKRTDRLVEKHCDKILSKFKYKFTEQFQNAEDVKLVQSLGGYVNARVQSQKGLINTKGFMQGFGNGAFFNNCMISPLPRNKREKKEN
ncbi:hypothetical protein L6164_023036 [Bauhinia variegata]|uniref:Uncharacterized protein n=1 Tax=Bauhinia variegata TaxID=167791 RepID=A0ACB9MHX6_BAUVA|nr:hypothetical protein L6164_023036 [Bauhinia variegata]